MSGANQTFLVVLNDTTPASLVPQGFTGKFQNI